MESKQKITIHINSEARSAAVGLLEGAEGKTQSKEFPKAARPSSGCRGRTRLHMLHTERSLQEGKGGRLAQGAGEHGRHCSVQICVCAIIRETKRNGCSPVRALLLRSRFTHSLRSLALRVQIGLCWRWQSSVLANAELHFREQSSASSPPRPSFDHCSSSFDIF